MILAWKYVSNIGIPKALRCCKYLHTLDLRGKIFDISSMSELVQSLKLCTKFKKISFGAFFPTNTKMIAKSLNQCELHTLNFCNIDKYSAKELADCLFCRENTPQTGTNESIPHQDFEVNYINNWSQNLVNLDLGSNRIYCEGAAALGRTLKCCHKLESLNLSDNGIEAKGAAMLAEGLESCHTLQALTMNNNFLGADGTAKIFSALRSCSKLKSLSFGNTILCYNEELKDAILEPLFDNTIFSDDYYREKGYVPTYLKKYFIPSKNSLCLKGIEVLAKNIENWSQFEELDLSSNNIDYTGAIILAEGLNSATYLKHLDLENNQLCANGTAVLLKSVENFQLKYLNFGSNIISEDCDSNVNKVFDGCEALTYHLIPYADSQVPIGTKILEGLQSFVNLKHLDLSFNNIGSSGVQALMGCIRCDHALEVLDLTGNGIDSVGALTLFTELKRFPKLNKICLCKNSIGSMSIETFINSIKILCQDTGMHNIKELHLGHNRIAQKGASVLAEGLKYCKNLTHLDLRNNGIGSKGAVAIAEGLKYCKNMIYLDLQSNSIDSTGAVELAKGLQFCSILQYLYVHKNSMNFHDINKIVDSLNCGWELEELIIDEDTDSSYTRKFFHYYRGGDTWETWKEKNCLGLWSAPNSSSY